MKSLFAVVVALTLCGVVQAGTNVVEIAKPATNVVDVTKSSQADTNTLSADDVETKTVKRIAESIEQKPKTWGPVTDWDLSTVVEKIPNRTGYDTASYPLGKIGNTKIEFVIISRYPLDASRGDKESMGVAVQFKVLKFKW